MKRWTTVLLALVFVLGLGVMLYPTVANYVNRRYQLQAIEAYNQEVVAEIAARGQKMIDDSHAYNQRLYEAGELVKLSDEELEAYMELLSQNKDGVMGYIEIPKINVHLMIAHTVDDMVLQRYVGHLPGTSLPLEGENVHCVLSAHRGLPSATLFSDLDQMEIGDTFSIHVLNQTQQYRVDDIRVILPEETEALNIIPGKNYVTLMTCTPYGINTHRLLVRGELAGVMTDAEEEAPQQEQQPAAPFYVLYRDEIVLATAGVLALVFIVLLLKRGGKKKESR